MSALVGDPSGRCAGLVQECEVRLAQGVRADAVAQRRLLLFGNTALVSATSGLMIVELVFVQY